MERCFPDRASSSKWNFKRGHDLREVTEIRHRKHQKRHEKPYGCTFSKCSKTFGSKNDWKRHENSQHHQLELWKCDEQGKTGPNELCGRACHRREQFKSHLLRDHDISDLAMIEAKLNSCRVGRDCGTRFWCGFCEDIVDIREGGWTERFDHIDNHFSGRNSAKMSISEWKSCEPESPDIDLHSPGSNNESRSGSSGSSMGLSSEVEHARKRGTDAVAREARPRKRLRTETMWFCVGFLTTSLLIFKTSQY